MYAPSGTPYEHHSFEADPSLATRFEVVMLGVGGNTYPPAGTVPVPWIWNQAGLAGSASTLTANPQSLPDQEFAAFLQSSAATGISTFTFPHTLPNAGTWRLSFLAAQRWQLPDPGEVVDHQRVRVTVAWTNPGGQVVQEVVFDDTIRDDTYRVHHTRPFVVSSPSITVTFEGTVLEAVEQTALIDLVEVREVRTWSSTGTWVGGVLPSSIHDVTIPITACVGVDSGMANTVDVQGELHGLESWQGGGFTPVRLSTRLLHVHGAGSLFQVGTEGCPYQSTFELVLDDVLDGLAETTNALLASHRGQIEMHGQRRTSWLRLAQTAPSGSSSIVLESVPVGWQVGHQIVVAASSRDFRQAEQRAIGAGGITANPNGTATVALAAVLTHQHCGVRQNVWTPNGTRVLDQRAEVGLLTHNVKVVATPRTAGQGLHGGHIMIKSTDGSWSDPASGRFSGVELENLGRIGQSGRYPIHWHMLLGAGKGQFMKNSSIHHSNHRVVAVHGTDSILFENNVAFEHVGHGVFIEDGSEQYNVFRNNLVMGTKRPAEEALAVLPSDFGPMNIFQNRSPATFWITNPHNTFEGNVAAGGEGVGYWFALPNSVMGFSATAAHFNGRAPRHAPLISFDNNSCHSTWLAVDINDSIDMSTSPPQAIKTNVTWKPPGEQVMQAFVAYSCNVGIYTGNGDHNVTFDQAIVADSSWAIAMASHDKVQNSVVVRDSANGLWNPVNLPSEFQPGARPPTALLLYDGAANLDRVHLVGYDGSVTNSNETAFWGVSAARRRTGIKMSGISSRPNLNAGALSWPLVGWQDFAAPLPPNPNFEAAHHLDPSAWAFSIDNEDQSLGRLLGSLGHGTVVSNHPMMLFSPGVIEMPLANTVANRAYESPYRFGFLRVICESLSGPASVQSPANQQFWLLYNRYRKVGQVVEEMQYEDRWRVLRHKQMAVVVDRLGEANGVSYLLRWSHPSVTSAPLKTELRLGEMQPNDAALIGLDAYVLTGPPTLIRRATSLGPVFGDDQVPTGAWETLPGVATMSALMASPASDWFADMSTGILWIRIVARAAAPGKAIVLHADGLGQLIEVNR